MVINILIVEDEAIISMDIENRLIKMGYNVVGIAKSCREALKIINKCIVDLVLMDIIITGEKDGIDTAMIIKNEYNIPVVYVSANIGSNLERIKLTEPYGYVLKPTDNYNLMISIELAFYKHQKDMERIKSSRFGFKDKSPKDYDILNEILE